MKYKQYIQPTCEVNPVSFLLNNEYSNDEGHIGISNGGAKDASLGQSNENGLFDGDENANDSPIWDN